LKERKKRMFRKYPRKFLIETPDGKGEAVKEELGGVWEIAIPTGAFKSMGSTSDAQRDIRERLQGVYSRNEVSFGELQ